MPSGLQLIQTPDQVTAREEARAVEAVSFEEAQQRWSEGFTDRLAAHLRDRYWMMRRHRTRTALHERMLAAMRSYNGQYDEQTLQQIRTMGGSEVYARLVAIKCRGATAMMRDVFLSGERPWTMNPTPVPDLPEDILEAVDGLLETELQTMLQAGQEVPPEALEERRLQLLRSAKQAGQKQAMAAAQELEKHVEDMLLEGGFYTALGEVLADLSMFPLAVIKGPVVQMKRTVVYENGMPEIRSKPIMSWRRVSPFDLYWTPGASRLDDADVIERVRLRRSDLQKLIGLPGYNERAIREALSDYTTGFYEFYEPGESERAQLEDRESPHQNESGLIDSIEFQGEIQGAYLKDWNNGEIARRITGFDEDFDYAVGAWVAGRHVIKVHVQPNPVRRHNYFATSFEKVPGSISGHGLPEILDDAEHVANSAFRSLVNNMGLASGPQVVIDELRLSPSTNPDSIYPWKRWRTTSDPAAGSGKPIDFFQPSSNAAELMGVFDKMMALADEVSGIPRYLTGNQNVGGAASTASGLNMLMNNASKVLQQVAAQIDTDVIQPLLDYLHFIAMVSDRSGLSWGDAKIVARGITMAMRKEADRQRQLEFLQLTANPLDFQIMGADGRAKILRRLDDSLGLGEDVVPDESEVEERQKQAMMQEQAAAAQGGQSPAPGASDNRPNRGLDNAQRTRSPQAIQRQTQP